jgi:hypothetical protein
MFQPVTLALFRGLFHSILAAAGPLGHELPKARNAAGRRLGGKATWLKKSNAFECDRQMKFGKNSVFCLRTDRRVCKEFQKYLRWCAKLRDCSPSLLV